MITRLVRLWRQPLSRKLQYLSMVRARLVTRWVHRWRLRACGSGSIVQRPLFWTPESISIGDGVLIWPGCRIECLESARGTGGAGAHIEIGDGVSMQQGCHVTAGGNLRILSGTTILFGVMITDMDHRYDQFGVPVTDQPIDVIETSIGRTCFIGSGAKILPGTRLGDHCVVGANAVVRGDFPAGSVIAGIPGRIVKQYDEAMRTWRKPGGEPPFPGR